MDIEFFECAGLMPPGHRPGEVGQCFIVCQERLRERLWEDYSLRYFEGVTDFVPGAPHAWLVEDGEIIDPTHPYPGATIRYCGVEIPQDEVVEMVEEAGLHRPLLPKIDPELPGRLADELLRKGQGLNTKADVS